MQKNQQGLQIKKKQMQQNYLTERQQKKLLGNNILTKDQPFLKPQQKRNSNSEPDKYESSIQANQKFNQNHKKQTLSSIEQHKELKQEKQIQTFSKQNQFSLNRGQIQKQGIQGVQKVIQQCQCKHEAKQKQKEVEQISKEQKTQQTLGDSNSSQRGGSERESNSQERSGSERQRCQTFTDKHAQKWMIDYSKELGTMSPKWQVQKLSEKDLEKEKQFQNDNYYIEFFSRRTELYFRERYLNKVLFNSKGGEEGPRFRNQHIFIFDWDDTLLCTSYLSAFQFQEIGAEAKATIAKLDECACNLLLKVKEIGNVYIITNAAKGWVEYSSKMQCVSYARYLPRTHEVLKNAKIMSARSMFSDKYAGDYAKWKIQAFKSILSSIDKYTLTNLICIGDSNIEMEAAHCLSKELNHCLVKTIKFRENPKPQELFKQQQLVSQRIKDIYQSSKNLTIRLERKQNPNDRK